MFILYKCTLPKKITLGSVARFREILAANFCQNIGGSATSNSAGEVLVVIPNYSDGPRGTRDFLGRIVRFALVEIGFDERKKVVITETVLDGEVWAE